MSADYQLKYRPPGPVAAAFLKHRPPRQHGIVPIDTIRGPIGSGKSVASIIRLFTHMAQQEPGADGVRRSRWAVLRNTNPELEMTTLKSWFEWFPEEHFGTMRWAKPYVHHFKFDPLKIEAEVWFIPCDDAAATKKLLSLELTGGWVNEFREIPQEVILALRSRCDRYPSRREGGVGASWAGVIADTNSPDVDHYLAWWEGAAEPPEYFDEATRKALYMPPGITCFVQPGGLIPKKRGSKIIGWTENDKAENLKHLAPGYYQAQIAGNTSRWVLTHCANQFGPQDDVRVIYEDFDASVHVSDEPLQFDPEGGPLLIGADFARNPAYIFAQEVGTQLRVLRECIGQNIDVAQFTKNEAAPAMKRHFPLNVKYRGWGDPSGNNRTGGDDSTAFTHAREGGLTLLRGQTNDPEKRQRAVTRRLTTMNRGEPAILISPVCTTLIQGFKGGYRFEKVAVASSGGTARYKDEPTKNIYSHVHDAFQYLCQNHDAGAARADDSRKPPGLPAGAQPNGRAHFDPFQLSRAARLGKR